MTVSRGRTAASEPFPHKVFNHMTCNRYAKTEHSKKCGAESLYSRQYSKSIGGCAANQIAKNLRIGQKNRRTSVLRVFFVQMIKLLRQTDLKGPFASIFERHLIHFFSPKRVHSFGAPTQRNSRNEDDFRREILIFD